MALQTENGWWAVEPGACEWRTVPGAEHVSIQVQKGWPATVLLAYMAAYHSYVEPIRDHDTACYTRENSVWTSNHKSATAVDINWELHPFKVNYAGFDADKIRRQRELLAFFNYKGLQIVFWAQDWNNPKDTMHHQMGYGTWNNPLVLEFIKTRIREDGFSTFQHGGTPSPPPVLPPSIDRVRLLADAMGNVTGVDYARLLPYYSDCLRKSNCDNNNRIAMNAAQLGHESVGFKYMKEIWGPTSAQLTYQGRMGNNNPGDGERYMGRGPIQVTGKNNYRALSEWAYSYEYVTSPTYFVDNPSELEKYEYAFLGAIWYWTVAQPRLNQFADSGNVEDASKAINAPAWIGTPQRANGIEDRINRWNRCRTMDLMPLLEKEGDTEDMAQVPQDQWNRLRAQMDRVERELTQLHPSRSEVREPNEGDVDTWCGMDLNTDGNVDFLATYRRAKLRHPKAIERLKRVAQGEEPGRDELDADVAKAILAEITSAPSDLTASPSNEDEINYLRRENARLREENQRLQQVSELPAVVVDEVQSTNGNTGKTVGRLITSVEDWMEVALSMDTKQRAALTKSLNVLELPKGNTNE